MLFVFSFDALGTPWQLQLHGAADAALQAMAADVQAWLRGFETRFSRFRADSLVSAVSAAPGAWHVVDDDDFWRMLVMAKEMETMTRGAFTLAMGGTLASFGYDATYSLQPAATPAAVGSWQLDAPGRRVWADAPLDLGGIGKGYALQHVASMCGAVAAGGCVYAGGDVATWGTDEAGAAWQLHLQHPWDATQAIGSIAMPAAPHALACSSTLHRRWGAHHHIVDASTSQPATGAVASYVLHADATLADAWATALCAVPWGVAAAWLQDGTCPAQACIVSSQGQYMVSKGWMGVMH